MKSLKIASAFALPLDFASQTSAALGIRGSGKTNTGAVIFEELLAVGHQVVAIDPTDVWWGLKASANGKDPGFPIVVLGGPHGDLPIEASSGSTIADFLVEHRASAVLSLRHLRKGDQRRFVTDFAERFYHRKGEAKNRTPVLLAIDECDAFIPQRVGGAEARMVGAIEDLVRRGRAAGIGVLLISQRAASINKDVLTQIELLIAHRHTSPHDRRALEAWIEAHDTADRRAEFMATLASMPVGTAWIWSPGWLDCFRQVEVRPRKTFDSSATPKPGQKVRQPKRLAEVDLARLKDQLRETIDQAAANDPKELKRQVAELRQQLAKQKPVDIEAEIAAAIVRDKNEFWQPASRAAAALDRAQRELTEAAQHMSAAARIGNQDGPTIATVQRTSTSHTRAVGKSAVVRSPDANNRVLKPPATDVNGHADVGTGGLRRILIALAQRPQGLSSRQVGVRAGLSSESGTFKTYLGKARSNEWVEGDRSRLSITPAGLSALGMYDPLPTGRELLAFWLNELGNSGAARMLEAAAGAYPRALLKDEIAEAAGLSAGSGTFKTYVGKLRTLELVQGRGDIRASDELFE